MALVGFMAFNIYPIVARMGFTSKSCFVNNDESLDKPE
jgi:hypothetical protein